ncbi:uncharacterized protein LOC143876448 [Tasmannia lanceolata]|uniref:uncharacterized protein LOC143876448 n=1 Tax=Tasmannia lanceolata TaxID=3420 RepID=UPI004063851F
MQDQHMAFAHSSRGMDCNLTRGAIVSMLVHGRQDMEPILQVYAVRPLNFFDNIYRRTREEVLYTMQVSDGTHLNWVMLAGNSNYLAMRGSVVKGSIIKVMDYDIYQVEEDFLEITLITVDILVETCDIIGNPEIFSGPHTGLNANSVFPPHDPQQFYNQVQPQLGGTPFHSGPILAPPLRALPSTSGEVNVSALCTQVRFMYREYAILKAAFISMQEEFDERVATLENELEVMKEKEDEEDNGDYEQGSGQVIQNV